MFLACVLPPKSPNTQLIIIQSQHRMNCSTPHVIEHCDSVVKTRACVKNGEEQDTVGNLSDGHFPIEVSVNFVAGDRACVFRVVCV